MFGFLALLTQEKTPPRNSGFCFTETMNNNCINEKPALLLFKKTTLLYRRKLMNLAFCMLVEYVSSADLKSHSV